MDVSIAPGSGLFLLPDAVTCFRSASYNQRQTFHLSDNTATLVLLDWFTSGRMGMGEEWAFNRYYSANEIWVNGKRLTKDVTLLEATGSTGTRTLANRLAPYTCYAMIILCGPLVEGVICHLTAEQKGVLVFKRRSQPDLMWSLSPLNEDKAAIVRVAGTEISKVRRWLGESMKSLRAIIGADIYKSVFSMA
jgi:urease accessory protein